MAYPRLPKPLPLGVTDAESIADSLRDVIDYLAAVPTVEQVTFEGVVAFPVEFDVSATRPFYVALTGRPYPDSNTPVVEVLGLTFVWERIETGSRVSIESIDGVAEGDAVTLSGIVVGERS